MGLHLVALAKLHLLSPSHSFTPVVAGLICPFVLKISFSSRIVRRVYIDVIVASRLFFFQLSQIVFDADRPALSNGDRWRRALRYKVYYYGFANGGSGYTLLYSSHGIISSILAGLACSFLLKISFTFSLLRQDCIDLCHVIRLLTYRMGQIAFGIESAAIGNYSSRWQQALHIPCARVISVRRSPASVETSFHALTSLSF
ncbi:hypothetical protein CRYUN_Cryun12cG0028500 [Craigia yunnanensis]